MVAAQPDDHIVLNGGEGPGKGKHIVFLAGDEEYRSEEAMPVMAQILARQGFKCTVLFSMDKDGKFVDPTNQQSLSNPAALDSADAIVMSLRFRKWDGEAMDKFQAAFHRGIPMVALRTSTHAFNFGAKDKWAKYGFRSKKETGWERGFGGEILGESWVNHHGKHKKEGTRTKVEDANKAHPVLNGVGEIFGATDVYGIRNATPKAPSTILLRGEVTQTLESNSPAVEGKKNDPMMPVAWVRERKNSKGKVNKIFTTTMGSACDLADENLRRLVANGVFWGLGLEVPAKLDVSVNNYKPTKYGFKIYKKEMKPVDYLLK